MELSERFESAISEVRNYEQSHPGVKYGSDFGSVATALYDSAAFKSLNQIVVMMGLFSAMTAPKGGSSKDDIDKFLNESPLREYLAVAFYAGFKAAMATRESAILERSMEDPDAGRL